MPELPEVETVRRGLEPSMVGARFVSVQLRRPDLRWPFPDGFVARLEGRRLTGLGRRAKYLLGQVEGGDVLVMHLGMSGRFSIVSRAEPGLAGRVIGDFVHDTGELAAHDHVVFHMSNGAVVTYNDPRRFGFMELVPQDTINEHKLFSGLGVEPLGNELSAPYLARRAAGKTTDLKAFLLDQRVVAGLGNIYVSEALFRAGLSPARRASCLASKSGQPTERAERLVPIIRQVLEEAIAAGGSTLRDYKHTDGSLGYFQHAFKVYGREGDACVRPGCGGTVRRILQSGRSTFFCGACQR